MPDPFLNPCTERVEALRVGSDVVAWLGETARAHGLQHLLAHADDGVVWGRLDGERMVTPSAEGVGAPLRAETLQEARLFSESGEVLVWRTEDGFRARLVTAAAGAAPTWDDCYDEPYLLWGSRAQPLASGFTLLEEGAEGLRHAPPLPDGTQARLPAALRVRHYVTYTSDSGDTGRGAHAAAGLARIAASRLVGFTDLPPS